jgi:hypothetical protein
MWQLHRAAAGLVLAGPLGTVQMMLNQLGLQQGWGGGASGGRLRYLNPGAMDPVEPSASAAANRPADSASNMRTIANVMQTLTAQLLPQQHRLLALPPRVPASESAALLEAANLQPQQQPEGAAAPAAPGAAPAAGADGSVRSQASTVSTLTRLVSRMNESAAPNSSAYLRDGRISVRHPGTGGLINVAINPSLLSPAMGPNSSLWQTLEALAAPGGVLSGQAGAMPGLAELNDSVWDEAVNQLLEVMAPNAGRSARMPAAGMVPLGAAGRATAAGAADNAGLDPREYGCSVVFVALVVLPPSIVWASICRAISIGYAHCMCCLQDDALLRVVSSACLSRCARCVLQVLSRAKSQHF